MRATFIAIVLLGSLPAGTFVFLGPMASGAFAQTNPRAPAQTAPVRTPPGQPPGSQTPGSQTPGSQTPPPVRAELGSPEAAFAGGPIKLSKGAAGLLRSHYQGDKVPIIPQPFRGRLDTALAARDWGRIETIKKEMAAAYGLVAVLAWEQSRFIGTGGIGIAELHALDMAATGSSGLAESAAMLWFYAVAATMTDGHKCADTAAKEAHLDKLRGPEFEPVLKLLRGLTEDRVVAMRDIALRLESLLAPERSDDTMCRTGPGKPDVKPDSLWRAAAASTRGMLPKHMTALTAVMRPKVAAKPEPGKPGAAKPVVAKPEPPKPAVAPVVAAPVQPPGPRVVKEPFGAPPASSLLAPLALPGAAGVEMLGSVAGLPVAGGLTVPLPMLSAPQAVQPSGVPAAGTAASGSPRTGDASPAGAAQSRAASPGPPPSGPPPSGPAPSGPAPSGVAPASAAPTDAAPSNSPASVAAPAGVSPSTSAPPGEPAPAGKPPSGAPSTATPPAALPSASAPADAPPATSRP